MTATAEPDPQTAIDERHVEAPALLEALDRRRDAKTAAREANAKARDEDAIVKALIAEHAGDLAAGDRVRVGQYVITARDVEEADVAFTRAGRLQLDIAYDA